MTLLANGDRAALAPRSVSGDRLCRLVGERTDLAHDAWCLRSVQGEQLCGRRLIDWERPTTRSTG
jgi:hypothetical protein